MYQFCTRQTKPVIGMLNKQYSQANQSNRNANVCLNSLAIINSYKYTTGWTRIYFWLIILIEAPAKGPVLTINRGMTVIRSNLNVCRKYSPFCVYKEFSTRCRKKIRMVEFSFRFNLLWFEFNFIVIVISFFILTFFHFHDVMYCHMMLFHFGKISFYHIFSSFPFLSFPFLSYF